MRIHYSRSMDYLPQFTMFARWVRGFSRPSEELELVWTDSDGEHEFVLFPDGEADNGFIKCPTVDLALADLRITLFG